MVRIALSKFSSTTNVSENTKFDEDSKPLNPNELLLSMFDNVSNPHNDNNNSAISDIESLNGEELAQSLLKNLLSQPPVNSNLSAKSVDQKKAHTNSTVPASSTITSLGKRIQPSLSTLNPVLASALSAINTNGIREIPKVPVLSRRLSGPVKLESPVVPFHIQRGNSFRSAELPSSHFVSYNGETKEVPDEIRCHLCNYPMKMCYRKSKYKSEIREYPAYRCLRKGCQTFRAVRKVIEPEELTLPVFNPLKREHPPSDETLRSILSQPPVEKPSAKAAKIPKRESNGTLIYVPDELTPEQVLELQQAAFTILSKNNPEGIYVAPLIVSSRFTDSEVKDLMCLESGRQLIRDEILNSKQLGRTDLLNMMNSVSSPSSSSAASRSDSPSMPTLEPESNNSSRVPKTEV